MNNESYKSRYYTINPAQLEDYKHAKVAGLKYHANLGSSIADVNKSPNGSDNPANGEKKGLKVEQSPKGQGEKVIQASVVSSDDDDDVDDENLSKIAMPKAVSLGQKNRMKFKERRKQLQRKASELSLTKEKLKQQKETSSNSVLDESNSPGHSKKSSLVMSPKKSPKMSPKTSPKKKGSGRMASNIDASVTEDISSPKGHNGTKRTHMKHSSSISPKPREKKSASMSPKNNSPRRYKYQSNDEEDGGVTGKEKDEHCPMFKLLNLDPSNAAHSLDEDAFLELIENDPKLCSKTYCFDAFHQDKMYPLHMICAIGASVSTVKKCYKAFTEAIYYKSSEKGNTVLHYAVKYTRAPLEVLLYLFRKEPDAIEALNKKRQTPLHLACMCSCTFSLYNPKVVMFLTEIGPDCTMKLDYHGRTPLALACKNDQPCLAIIEDLTEVGPDACMVQCKHGKCTPLHLACANQHVGNAENQVVNVIKNLLRSNPSAVKVKNEMGMLPIFVAVENKACLKILSALVKRYPDSLECTNNEGLMPHELARSLQLHSDIITFLYP